LPKKGEEGTPEAVLIIDYEKKKKVEGKTSIKVGERRKDPELDHSWKVSITAEIRKGCEAGYYM